MSDRCEHCGRFMRHVEVPGYEHEDGGYEVLVCSQDRAHAEAFPDYYYGGK